MLFELRPDVIAQPWLTDVELILWSRHFESEQERTKR
jgi:hypothetical protein